jgi:cytochrome c oxidase cbb3-type subunit 3
VYDGIVEQNNPMPSWWIWLFILCIIFGFIYWIHYFSNGETLRKDYDQAYKAYQAEVERAASVAQVETEESLTTYMKGEAAIATGAGIFASKCAMCHGENLQGKIGPNLTDNFWTTGDGSRMAVLHTITKGSAVKGMPAWEGMLKPKEIKDVASFVYSKIGSNPANPKAPEGTEAKK